MEIFYRFICFEVGVLVGPLKTAVMMLIRNNVNSYYELLQV